jgi:iron-sulfur cluster repair protein YtfE (RIC family)
MTAGAEPDIDEPTKPTAIFKAFGKVPADAVLLLEQDHREVESCFTAYKHLTDETAKQKVRDKIYMLLKAHMLVEEQIFYPEARVAAGDDGMVDHAVEEHTDAKRLIGDIEARTDESEIDALVNSLREAIEKHVSEEETQFFPKVRRADIHWYGLGETVAARRTELLRQLKAGALLKAELQS